MVYNSKIRLIFHLCLLNVTDRETQIFIFSVISNESFYCAYKFYLFSMAVFSYKSSFDFIKPRCK